MHALAGGLLGQGTSVLCSIVLCLLLIGQSVCAKNYLNNPGFEEGMKGWVDEGKDCEIVTDNVHSGTKALHCKDTGSGRAGVYQIPVPVVQGLRYRVSGFFKVKDVTGGSLMLCAESSNYIYGVYGYSSSIAECKSGTCTDQWYKISVNSEMFFGNASRYVYLACLHNGNALGEFWIDDLSIEPVETDILGYIETTAWKQEVYRDPIEIYVNLLINNSIWHNGTNFTLHIDIVDEDDKIVDTLDKFVLGYREENRIATFIYDPSKLDPGFYKVRATTVNDVFDGRTETVETNLRKLEKKRDLEFYVDQKTLVAYDKGKPFFPKGLFMNSISDHDIDLITDSPFNLLLSYPQLNKKRLDEVYERSGGRLRVINNLGAFPGCKSDQQSFDDMYNKTVTRVLAWRESKGLFGYYIADEPGECATKFLRNITLTIRDLDPNHVTYAAVNQRFKLNSLKEGMDAVGIDCYPLQHYDDLHAIYIMSIQARARTCNARARWDIPQIFDWDVYNASYGGKPPWDKISIHDERPPNEQQLRQMTYQWIVGGGMGVIYYDFSEVQVMNYKNPFDQEWAKIKKVVQELEDEYVPIITSGYSGSPRFYLPFLDSVTGKNYVGWRKFYYKGYSYFLIVNVKAKAQNYSFIKPDDAEESDIEMIMGSSNMTIVNNTVTLIMPSTDVVWLRVYDKEWFPDDGGFPIWAIVLITLAVAIPIVAGLVILAVVLDKK